MINSEALTIGITLGDPGGIGPEVTIKALTEYKTDPAAPIHWVLFGSQGCLDRCRRLLPESVSLDYISVGNQPTRIGYADPVNGQVSANSIETACQWALANKIDAMVTAPICKQSWQMANIPYTGHTTMLKALTQAKSVRMAFFTPRLKTILATVHCPLSEVPKNLTPDCLYDTAEHAVYYAYLLGFESPRLVLAGLNPHAGENGLIGSEEQTLLIPFLDEWNQHQSVPISGPEPADTLYYRAAKGEFDLVISLYHDQGLIPIKLIGFDHAVNLTLGLPFIRTSPDHGTAFDIVGKNQANPDSMKAAIDLAIQLIHNQVSCETA